MLTITSGKSYYDIDAYAGCLAYAELQNLRGNNARAVMTAPLNQSISKSVKQWGAIYRNSYTAVKDESFVIIDTSDPTFFETFVDEDRVVEVFDHHPGFEAYWQQRLGTAAIIEPVGAACTIVWEKWRAAGRLHAMSRLSARLLIAGIHDNTLNFKAVITDERDHTAYEDLVTRADLPADWEATYFSECQSAIEADLNAAINNDCKTMDLAGAPGRLTVGQLVVWDGSKLVKERAPEMCANLAARGLPWFMNVISISEGSNYIVCDEPAVQAWLSTLVGVGFADSVAKTDRLWLRKELMARAREVYP